jgi:hypothetical protein
MKLAVWTSKNYTETGSFMRLLKGCVQRGGYDAWGVGSGVEFHNALLDKETPQQKKNILTLFVGKEAAEKLTGFDFSGKGCTIQDIRGSLLPLEARGWGTLTVPPELVSVGWDKGIKGKAQSQYYPYIVNDVKRANHEPFVPRVEVTTPGELCQRHNGQPAPKHFSLDIEGKDGKPNLVGISVDKRRAYVFQYPGQEAEVLRLLENWFEAGAIPILHNASYDIPELMAAGLKPPTRWIDTINTGALLNPSSKLALQAQVLSYVDGSITWKGLINHEKGPDYVDKKVGTYRKLWTEVLARLGRRVPSTGQEWYCFYNGLDNGYTFALMEAHVRALRDEGRWDYYTQIMEPIQVPLVYMSMAGVPCNQDKLAFHRKACERLVKMATKTLQKYGSEILEKNLKDKTTVVEELVYHRTVEQAQAGKRKKFSRAGDLTKARAQLKTAFRNSEAGFNPLSNPQRTQLLYEHLKLPVKKKRGAVGLSADEKSLLTLRSQVFRETIKVRKPYTKKDVLKILDAMLAATKWDTWRGNFLNPPLKDGKIITAYAQHRASTGRLSSGVDTSDPDKGKRSKVQQLQNVPKALRDIVEAPEGFSCVGADWSNIEWVLTMLDASKVPGKWVAEEWEPVEGRDAWYIQNFQQVVEAYSTGYFNKLIDRFLAGDFDAHRYLASFAYSKPEADITKNERSTCKPYTHGYDFDGQPGTLAYEAGHPAAVGLKVCAAHDEAFMSRPWKDFVYQNLLQDKRVQTYAGWRRYFWDLRPKPTEGLGTKIQATAADLMKWTMARMATEEPRLFVGGHEKDWQVITTTHDSLLLLSPTATVEECAKWLKTQYFQRAIPWAEGRSFRADVVIGRTWRDVC